MAKFEQYAREVAMSDQIVDMRNFILKRQQKGKTPVEIRQDLMERGYDFHAAHGLVMLYWETDD